MTQTIRERAVGNWPDDCHTGLEAAIVEFKDALPGRWYSVGECQVSCDASCAPARESQDISLIPRDSRFDGGFHVDIPQPSTLAEAVRDVMHQALEARAMLRRLTGTGE